MYSYLCHSVNSSVSIIIKDVTEKAQTSRYVCTIKPKHILCHFVQVNSLWIERSSTLTKNKLTTRLMFVLLQKSQQASFYSIFYLHQRRIGLSGEVIERIRKRMLQCEVNVLMKSCWHDQGSNLGLSNQLSHNLTQAFLSAFNNKPTTYCFYYP